MKTCQYIDKKDGEILCQLGLYGGKPKPHNCIACIKSGNNNPEFAKELKETHAKSHPSGKRRVSGCCDSAENPPT